MTSFSGARAAYHLFPFMYYNRASVTEPRAFNWLKALRENEAANLRVGAAAFCWGATLIMPLCADVEKATNGKSLIDAGFTAHPSATKLPDDIERLQKPLSIANGTQDFQLTVSKMEQVKEIFARKEPGKYELVVYEGAKHGFAVRGNPKVERELKWGLDAEDQAIAWFDKWLVPS